MQYKVINPFADGQQKGDVVELNERRAKSELLHGNIEPVQEKKFEKVTYKNKAYKGKRKTK